MVELYAFFQNIISCLSSLQIFRNFTSINKKKELVCYSLNEGVIFALLEQDLAKICMIPYFINGLKL